MIKHLQKEKYIMDQMIDAEVEDISSGDGVKVLVENTDGAMSIEIDATPMEVLTVVGVLSEYLVEMTDGEVEDVLVSINNYLMEKGL